MAAVLVVMKVKSFLGVERRDAVLECAGAKIC